MNELYKKQVALLIRIMPSVYAIKDFAVHGGTAINLFHKEIIGLLRYIYRPDGSVQDCRDPR